MENKELEELIFSVLEKMLEWMQYTNVILKDTSVSMFGINDKLGHIHDKLYDINSTLECIELNGQKS